MVLAFFERHRDFRAGASLAQVTDYCLSTKLMIKPVTLEISNTGFVPKLTMLYCNIVVPT